MMKGKPKLPGKGKTGKKPASEGESPIPESRQMGEELHLLEHVFDSIPDVIGIQDLKHHVLFYNRAGYEFFNNSPKNIMGCHCFRLLGRQEQCDDCAAARVLSTNLPSRVTRYFHEMGKWLDVRAYPVFDSERRIIRIIEHIRDITEDKIKEIELEAAREKAEESDRLKSAFLDNISHEIRTPLNAIIGFSDLIAAEYPKSSKITKYIEYIRNSGLGLMQMINDILDYSLLETGQLKPEIEQCDLGLLLEELRSSFLEEIHRQKKEINLEWERNGNLDNDVILSDPNRLRQVLWNLLQNGVDFTRKGSIRFGYSKHKPGHITFFVEDTGIGIPPEDQNRVFEKFYTSSSRESDPYQGSGIGLALAKSLAELIGGTLYFKSTVGKGSVFYLDIPSDLSRGADKAGFSRPSAGMPKYNWEGKHILIAEDEELNYLFLREALSVTRVKLTWAHNGFEAVDFCKQHPGETDLILMDIKMPGMDGYEAATRIRKLNRQVPVVAQSAYLYSTDKKKSASAGFNDFLTKPIPPRLLLETLNRHLKS